MHRHTLLAIVAWLLGAATATAGSLLAISLLGQGITGSSGQLLTPDAIHRALASETAEPSATPTIGQQPSTSATPSASSRPGTPSPTAAPATVPPATDPATAPASADGTLLSSAGGEAVASCQASGVYLDSWSPSQGYEVSDVTRGPAATAQVSFESTTSEVTMTVSCSSGVPSATSSVQGNTTPDE